jgi:hypothetical protein
MHLTVRIGSLSLYLHLAWGAEEEPEEAVGVSDGELVSEIVDQGDQPNAEMRRTAGFEPS